MAESNPRSAVSVLLPVYNGQALVARAIESILRQTFSDFELIVVNDGSTDGTAAILGAFASADRRVRVLDAERNRGLPAALNMAFAASTGDLLARMDADDVALPQRLERQVDFLRRHPEVDVLGCAAYEIDRDGHRTGIVMRREDHLEMVSRIYKENPFIHPSVMFRRRMFAALNGYDEALRRGQDHDLWLRGYRTFRYHNLAEPLIEYTASPRPTWRNYSAAIHVVSRAGFRDKRPFSGAFYAGRIFAAYAWSKLRRAVDFTSAGSRR